MCVHRARTARAQRTHDRKKLGVVCYIWQYSCLYKPYYTPTTLDSPMFAKAEHKKTATELGTVTQCRQDRASR